MLHLTLFFMFACCAYAFDGGHLLQRPPEECSKFHTVEQGDTCDSLWKRARLLSLESLLTHNQGLDCDLLLVNQKICIDGSKEHEICGETYMIKSGDSCHSISENHNITTNDLEKLNSHINCAPENVIYIGQLICVREKTEGEEDGFTTFNEETSSEDPDAHGSSDDHQNHENESLSHEEPNIKAKESRHHSENEKTSQRNSKKLHKTQKPPNENRHKNHKSPNSSPQKPSHKSTASHSSKHSQNLHSSHSGHGILVAHNKARSEKGLAPLSWSPALASASANYARYLSARKCKLVHSDRNQRGPFGENLSMKGLHGPMARGIEGWYNEKYYWRYGSKELNHYTQVMWKGTQKIGCGQSIGSNGCQVIVCRYWPP